jgi:hypothetical protein
VRQHSAEHKRENEIANRLAADLDWGMERALAALREYGELECRVNGFWTYPGCESSRKFGRHNTPLLDWSVGPRAIAALIANHEVVVTERRGGEPSRVKLAQQEIL